MLRRESVGRDVRMRFALSGLSRLLAGIGLLALLAACAGQSADVATQQPAAGDAGDAGTPEAGDDSAFQSDYESIMAAAAEEPPVQWCTGMGPDEYGAMIDAFSEAHPEVPAPEGFECSGEEATQRVLAEWEADATQVDIVDTDNEILVTLDEQDLTHVQDWSVFDGSPVEVDPDQLAFDGRIVTVTYAHRIIAYNTDLKTADEIPQSFEECADPSYKGELAIDVRPTWFEFMEEAGGPWDDETAREWAAGIAANEPLWVRGASQGFAVLASGERAIHCGLQLHGLFRGGRTDPGGEDAVVDFILPERTIQRTYLDVGIAPEPNAPNGTILFVAWMASEGQRVLNEVNPGYGSASLEGTFAWEEYQEQGAEVLMTSQEEVSAVSDHMNQIMLEEWGFPTAVPE